MDPDDLVRDSMQLFLEGMGCRVMTSGNADNALRCLSENEYDALVCARDLPEMDGLGFIRQIRKLYPKMLRVLECDDRSSMEFFREAKLAGAHEVIHKPYTATDVEKVVSSLNLKYWVMENGGKSAGRLL